MPISYLRTFVETLTSPEKHFIANAINEVQLDGPVATPSNLEYFSFTAFYEAMRAVASSGSNLAETLSERGKNWEVLFREFRGPAVFGVEQKRVQDVLVAQAWEIAEQIRTYEESDTFSAACWKLTNAEALQVVSELIATNIIPYENIDGIKLTAAIEAVRAKAKVK